MTSRFTTPPSDWHDLADAQARRLRDPGFHRHCHHGELIFRKHDPVDGPTVILSGAAYFFVDDPSKPRGEDLVQLRWGGEILLYSLVPGKWPESLRSIGNTTLGVVPFADYLDLQQTDPVLSQRVLPALVNQVLRDHDRLRLQRGLVVDRMAALLEHLAAYTGKQVEDGYLLDYPMRLSDWATLVRAHPVECSRALTALRERGFVAKRPRFRLVVRGFEVVRPQPSPAELAVIQGLC